jgi:hypothetical protein
MARASLVSGLKDLAVLAAAANTRCSWCPEPGYWALTARHDVMAGRIAAGHG